jgi:hypothetical protein
MGERRIMKGEAGREGGREGDTNMAIHSVLGEHIPILGQPNQIEPKHNLQCG